MFAPVSLDDPVAHAVGTTVGDAVAESGGYSPMMGQPIDGFTSIHRRLDLNRAVGALPRSYRTLCVGLMDRTPTELSRDGFGSRASLYRYIQEIRLRLVATGISSAA
jgi:hypothetical protein